MSAVLSDSEVERYSRQLVLPEWGGEAQARLKRSSAVVVGLGALGTPVATYLAAAGIGRLALVDSDAVELSNLHRQPLHYTPDIGAPKALSAAAKLGVLNPEVLAEPFAVLLDEHNAAGLLGGADVVLDCSDSFHTRYLVNETCCAQGTPLVEAAVQGFGGLLMTVRPGSTACYRCAFPDPPAPEFETACRDTGVIGASAGALGCLQALEGIKLLTGVGAPFTDRVVHMDLLDGGRTVASVARRGDCPSCGGAPGTSESA